MTMIEEQAGAHAAATPLAPGTLLKNRYQVQTCVGRGASSTVYRAIDLQLASLPVAVKVFHQSFMRLPHFASMYSRELQTSYAVDHENVVRLYDMIKSDGLIALVTEFIDGITLDEYVEQCGGKIASPKTRDIILAVLRGLDAIHSHGLVHRDVKPQNILISQDNAVKINDFGVARSTNSSGGSGHNQHGRTAVEQLSGTPYYTAPEYMAGGQYDSRSDLHSVGIIAFESLTGCPLFDTTSPAGFLISKVEGEIPPVSSMSPDSNAPLATIIDRLLQKDPAKRYSSAREAIVELEQVKISGSAASWSTPDGSAGSPPEHQSLSGQQTQSIIRTQSSSQKRRTVLRYLQSGAILYPLAGAVLYYLVYHTRLIYWIQNKLV